MHTLPSRSAYEQALRTAKPKSLNRSEVPDQILTEIRTIFLNTSIPQEFFQLKKDPVVSSPPALTKPQQKPKKDYLTELKELGLVPNGGPKKGSAVAGQPPFQPQFPNGFQPQIQPRFQPGFRQPRNELDLTKFKIDYNDYNAFDIDQQNNQDHEEDHFDDADKID